MELAIFLVSLFLLLFLGIPICLVLVLCSVVLMYHSGMWDSMIIPQAMLDGANNYPLMAIPFFVFAGEIMAVGGLSERVVRLAQLLIGRVRGGLGYAAVVSSVIFAGLMGSSVGEAAALGGLLLPMMAQVGYKPGRAGGVIASGAILGPIIPPSTNFILLGTTVSLSITKLFMIGLIPGLLIGLALLCVWFARYELGRSLGSEGHHHHHAICLGCKAVISLEEDLLGALEQDLLERLGFAVTDHEVKLYGYCRVCRKKSACAGKKEQSL